MSDIEQATIRMQRYWTTYDEQLHYKDYSDETFILDALYGIGIALDPEEYEGPSGFGRFNARLMEILERHR